MEPDFAAMATQRPQSWEDVCRLLARIDFAWREDKYSGLWLAVGWVGADPVLFHGDFGSCSGCDELVSAGGDAAEVASIIQGVWDGRVVGADKIVAGLERIGNDAWTKGAMEAVTAAAASLGLSVTLMEVEP